MLVVTAVSLLAAKLADFMTDEIRQVAARKAPALMAFLPDILRWPDRTQPRSFIIGFRLVSDFGITDQRSWSVILNAGIRVTRIRSEGLPRPWVWPNGPG